MPGTPLNIVREKEPTITHAALVAIVAMGSVCLVAFSGTLCMLCWACGWCERVPVKQEPEFEEEAKVLKGPPPAPDFPLPKELGKSFRSAS